MDYKLLSKNIGEYLLRVFCFIFAIKCWFIYFADTLGLLALPIVIISLIYANIRHPEYEIIDYNFTFEIYTVSFVTLYLLAKIFGIFKKLDKLNIFTSLIIVSEISCLLTFVGRMDILILDKSFHELTLEYNYIMYSLIPAFLLYKFFGFLTIKFPVPFKKIGYYTSIEFPKDLYSKIKKNYIKKP